MSGFDQNPFAEPAVYNPFGDPAVQQAAGNNTIRAQQGLEEYNPFEENQQQQFKPSAPAVLAPTMQTAPIRPAAVPVPQQPQLSTAEFQRRQEELEQKARELQRREEELRNAPPNSRHNWPPLPDKFCVQPCFYQDINVEIPLEFQKVVRMLYYIWMFHSLLYVLNVVGCLALFIQLGSGSMFGLSILYCVLFTPASYVCWFRPVYKAFRSDSSFNFMVFFCIFFGQLVATVIQAVGIPNLGTCGFIVSLSAMSQGGAGNITVGAITLIIGMGFGAAALGDFLLIVRVSRLYRNTGASLSKAGAEFSNGFMRNEHVQQVTTNLATSAIRNQMSAPRF